MHSAYNFLSLHEAYPKAKAAALQALEIEETLAEAYTSLANIKYRYDFNWLGAEKDFKKAIELNPNYPLAHHWFGELLRATGRFSEVHKEFTKALGLDPLSISIRTSFALIRTHQGQYEESIAQSKKTLEIDPNYGWVHKVLAETYLQKSRYDEAIDLFRKATAISSGYLPGLGYAYAAAGNKEKAVEILEELITQSQQIYVSNYRIARIYAGLGEKEKALEYLDKSYEDRDGDLFTIGVDSGFKNLHPHLYFLTIEGGEDQKGQFHKDHPSPQTCVSCRTPSSTTSYSTGIVDGSRREGEIFLRGFQTALCLFVGWSLS